MFMAIYRFFKSMEMGMRFSMVAARTQGQPDLLRQYVLAELGYPVFEPAPAVEVPERELQLAA